MGLIGKFNTLALKVTNAQNEMLVALKYELKKNGEQNLIYCDKGVKIVPISFINENGDAEFYNLDKIRYNDSEDNNTIEVHDSDYDSWEQLFMFPYDTIAVIISHIDWK